MNDKHYMIIIFIGLLATISLALEVGRRVGRFRVNRGTSTSSPGMTAIEGSLFALMGLVIAFSFNGAAERFYARRHLIVEETNAIEVAWLRIDALPADTQPALRDLFRRYLDSRLATYRNVLDRRAMAVELDRSEALQAEIWQLAIAATRREDGRSAIVVVLNALNAMFDIRTTRIMALRQHPPFPIFIMLWLLVSTGAFLAGNGMANATSGRWPHMVAYTILLAVTLYITVDMEFPRAGLIRVDSFDAALQELRHSMDVPTGAP